MLSVCRYILTVIGLLEPKEKETNSRVAERRNWSALDSGAKPQDFRRKKCALHASGEVSTPSKLAQFLRFRVEATELIDL